MNTLHRWHSNPETGFMNSQPAGKWRFIIHILKTATLTVGVSIQLIGQFVSWKQGEMNIFMQKYEKLQMRIQ